MNVQTKLLQNSNYNITQADIKQKTNYNYPTDNVSFSGLHTKDGRALFVFDFDGTFAHGTDEDIKKVLELKEKTNAVLVYATGRTLEKYKEKQEKLAQKQLFLPDPDFLISRNGLNIYENKSGELVEDKNWDHKLTTSFPKEEINNIVLNIASKPEYLMPFNRFRTDEQLKSRSKIVPYEFWPSSKMVEIICDPSVVDSFQRIIIKALLAKNIKCKLVRQSFSKKECDEVSTKEQLAIMEPRYDKNNHMTQIDLVAANKADGIEYIRKKLKIPYQEIVMAGDDENDISMANLSLKGAYFICVANAVNSFKRYLNKIKDKTHNILFPQNEGASGISDGINTILSKNN